MIELLLALLLSPAAETPPAPALTLRVSGLVSSEASVRAALFDSKAGWDGDAEPLATAVLQPQAGACEWRLPELPPGEYAARAFQDLDGDGELGRNERGRPVEPYGFSGAKKGLFGPPGWRKVRFPVDGETATVEIELRSREDAGDDQPS